MNKELFADPGKCTGCSRCTYVCSAVKTGEFAPVRARIQINNYPQKGFSAPSICFQCPAAPCLKACPHEAMERTAEKVVKVEARKCTGCGSCITACPYGMIDLDARGVAAKCDLCDGDPACVKECYPGALVCREKTPELIALKAAQMKHRAKDGSPAQKRHRLGKALLALGRG